MMLGFQSCGCNCRLVLAAWQDAYFFRRASAVTRLKVKQQQQQHHVSFHQFVTSPATKTLRCKSSNTSDGFKSRLSEYNFHDIKRHESSKPKQRGLVKAVESPYAGLSPAQKVKEAGKDTAYTGVIIVGVGVTALMFYAIGKELFSKQSPSGVYGQALKLCKQNTEIVAALGEPIKGYGELSRRGRRRHVSHAEFDANGVHHMRMKFYIEGPERKGTVQLEVRQNDSGKYEYRYLFVELDGYPHRRIVLQDNR